MAVRQTAAQKAEAAARTAPPKPAAGTPAAWGSEPIDDFNGHNPTDKADLIGVPFLIIGAEIERTEGKEYDVAWVYALDIEGNEFEFSDASTGVREQIKDILSDRSLPATAGEGFQKLRVRVMGGLRASEFTIPDPERPGKTRTATTYYLAASGRRPAENKP